MLTLLLLLLLVEDDQQMKRRKRRKARGTKVRQDVQERNHRIS